MMHSFIRKINSSSSRILSLIVMLVFVISSLSAGLSWAEPDDTTADPVIDAKYKKKPPILAASAVLINANTGEVLLRKKMNKRREPASTTKIMTALLALENLETKQKLKLTDDVLIPEGSSIMLLPGEKISVNNLLYAALLQSGNDAAVALAEGVDTTLPAFIARMNSRAEELGMTRTHFKNPHGLHDKAHYTTAYDLSILAREAMKNEDFRNYVSTYEHKIKKTNIQPERLVHNTNQMIYDSGWHVYVYGERIPIMYDDATGIKTGFTNEARNTLVASAERDGLSLIAVVLKGEGVQTYQDAISMFEYGFHNYEEMVYVKKGDPLPVPEGEDPIVASVIDGTSPTIAAVCADDLITTVKKGKEPKNIFIRTSMSAVSAPVEHGQVIGRAFLTVGEDEKAYIIGETDLLADSFVAKKRKPVFEGLKLPPFVPLILKIIGILIGLAALWVIVVIIRSENQRRKRRLRRMYGYRGDGITREVRRIKRIK